MKIAFCADPLAEFKIYKDSTYAMMAEATRRGHEVYAFEQSDMAIDGGIVVANVARIRLHPPTQSDSAKANWYQSDEAVASQLSQFDAIIMRKDPPFDMEYIYATYLLELAENQGARVFNRPAAVRNHNEKLAIAQFPHLTAPTLVTSDAQRIRAFHATHQDIILKPLDGMGGAGIFRVRDDGMNLGAIVETLTVLGRRTIMVQRFIPAIASGDKRILLIGGAVVPFSLARIPQNGEVRGNLAAGGLGVAQPLSARDQEIATGLAPELAARGLLLVGLDVIGDYLTEINVTSPTCFQEITTQSGFDVAAFFIDAVENAC
jgi:glutathione synthase